MVSKTLKTPVNAGALLVLHRLRKALAIFKTKWNRSAYVVTLKESCKDNAVYSVKRRYGGTDLNYMTSAALHALLGEFSSHLLIYAEANTIIVKVWF